MDKRNTLYNLISCVFVFLVAVVFLISSFTIEDSQSRMLPLILCGLTILLSVVFFIMLVAKKYNDHVEINFAGTRRVAVFFLILCGYVLINYLTGYYIATVIFMPIAMFALGQRKPWVILAATVLLPAGVYLFFDLLLAMQMPQGILF